MAAIFWFQSMLPPGNKQPTSPPPQLIFAVYYVPYYNSRNILYSIIGRSRIQAAHCFTMTIKHNARQALNLIHPQNNFMIKIAGWDCTHSCIYKDFNQHSSIQVKQKSKDVIVAHGISETDLHHLGHTPTEILLIDPLNVAVGESAGLSFLGLTGYAVLPKPVLKIP